jgi:hypothetical protein
MTTFWCLVSWSAPARLHVLDHRLSSSVSTVALTAGSDTPTANDRRNLLIAQRRADDVHSGSRRDLDELSLVRKGQFPFNDALSTKLSALRGHVQISLPPLKAVWRQESLSDAHDGSEKKSCEIQTAVVALLHRE